MKKRNKKLLSIIMSASVMLSYFTTNIVKAEESDDAINTKQAGYGYYVDVYRNNSSDNMTPEINPAIGVLSQFLNYWKPGTEWNNGTILNSGVHNKNIELSKKIADSRTKEAEDKAYLDDRMNQSYSTITGLGPYSDRFKKGTNAGTTIADVVPSDANVTLYNDEGNSNGQWADVNTEYGNIVQLVNTIRGDSASTSSAKKYYKYMRPFRWENGSRVQDSLTPAIKSDPSNDGGFPSGHTNASYLAAYGMAYAVPERYQEMLTRASELGNNRIVAGMHSCLDVMGGRVMSTAIAAAVLNNPENVELKEKARSDGQKLMSADASGYDEYGDYQSNKEKYIERLTYGFEPIGDTTKPMIVPKGAEVLIESRFPYLDNIQRRYVLYTTGLPSGYPLLDDAEGWGRLNLFEAADGYGAFTTDVTVNMEKEKGGFNAIDNWKNDISGEGSLTKEGSGELILSGDNTYSGGTTINGGSVVMESSEALGNGDVTNNSTLSEEYNGKIEVAGNYKQGDNSVLELNISSKDDILKILGQADFKGELVLNFNDGYVPTEDMLVIDNSNYGGSKFSKVTINGLDKNSKAKVVYDKEGLVLTDKDSIADKNNNSNNAVVDDGKDRNITNNKDTDTNTNESGNKYSETPAKTGDASRRIICTIAGIALVLYIINGKLRIRKV